MEDPPCVCEYDHGYTRKQAAEMNYVCKKDGSPITCKPNVSSAPPKSDVNDGSANDQ